MDSNIAISDMWLIHSKVHLVTISWFQSNLSLAIVNLGVLFPSLLMQLHKMCLEGALLWWCPCIMSLYKARSGAFPSWRDPQYRVGTGFQSDTSLTGSIWGLRGISRVKSSAIHISSVQLDNMTHLSQSTDKIKLSNLHYWTGFPSKSCPMFRYENIYISLFRYNIPSNNIWSNWPVIVKCDLELATSNTLSSHKFHEKVNSIWVPN